MFQEGECPGSDFYDKSLVKRQEDDEIKASYGSGPYRLSQPFKKFAIDSINWHNIIHKRELNMSNNFENTVQSWKIFCKTCFEWAKSTRKEET